MHDDERPVRPSGVRRLVVAPRALQDIEDILAHSELEFGETTRDRYQLLIRTALLELARDPNRAGVISRSELAPQARTYHLAMSRNRMPRGQRIRRPRHLLVFRTIGRDAIEIGRVLHDTMELARHLPLGYAVEED